MPVVIGTDPKHVYTATCKKCASIVQYTLIEVKEVNGKDYSGGSDGYEYITCPTCRSKIVLRSW